MIVECAAFVCCSGLGLATGGASIPYLAGWGEDGALDAVRAAAELIDEIAGRIERAAGLHHGDEDTSVQAAFSIAAATPDGSSSARRSAPLIR